jgi:hypothetical protein
VWNFWCNSATVLLVELLVQIPQSHLQQMVLVTSHTNSLMQLETL